MKIDITPVSKPRMTQSDRWKNRDCVVRYWEYKDRLKLLWGDREVPDKLNLIFVLPMPKSWSGKKRLAMKGQPCQSKPDIDNLVKGWMDALLDDDARIWSIQASKVWGETGSIELC